MYRRHTVHSRSADPCFISRGRHDGSDRTEHIHAQHSEGLNTQELWKEWLKLHIASVKTVIKDEDLVATMQAAMDNPNLDRKEFDDIQQKVTGLLSVQGNTEYLHSISNMALLRSDDNAALNNSTFDVKRNQIIEMDKAGQYIPFCTKMVFLKYYTPSEDNQLHFWGQADRIAAAAQLLHHRALAHTGGPG